MGQVAEARFEGDGADGVPDEPRVGERALRAY
jgi:hypothetical protein